MGKPCKADNCYSRRWGGGFCQRHQWMRDDKKKKSIAKITATPRANKIGFGFEDQLSMFQALWENAMDKNGVVTCPYTGECLNRFYNTEMWYSCFAHVLPKGRYTYFKLNPANIRIVHPDFHTIVDQGSSDDRTKHPDWDFDKWDGEKEAMKVEYQKFKNENQLS